LAGIHDELKFIRYKLVARKGVAGTNVWRPIWGRERIIDIVKAGQVRDPSVDLDNHLLGRVDDFRSSTNRGS
jgi:hypothetical protein